MPDIPRYKRDKFIFVSNLQEVTASEAHPITLKREAYLLSDQYSNTEQVARAKWVKARRNLLVSDNGNFSRMSAIAKTFEQRGETILNKALDEQEEDGAISEQTLSERLALIAEIEAQCDLDFQSADFNQIIATQTLINPDYIIGLEDYVIPVLMMCGLTHPIFKPKAASIKARQKKTQEIFKQQRAGAFGKHEELQGTHQFLVLHAYDYASAFQGAKQLQTPADGIAISYGGPMKSKRWITEMNFNGKNIRFNEKLPEPYLVSTAITLGANDGLEDNLPIHILGVGTPILVALIGHMLRNSRAVSIDSTAPFKDAYVGTLYGSRSAFLKMDMYKVAAITLINNTAYTSTTPFFKSFENDFPSNWSKMRAELGVSSSSTIKNVMRDFKQNPDLVEANTPFFSKMRSGDEPMLKRLRMDRSGHNYWILRNICMSVRERMGNTLALEKWMQYQVKRYTKIGSRKWGLAVQAAFDLSQR
ncbi:hypothetical protein PN836_005420 [Ningiella sp. W23]|uniref:hypothetical protein n=1 Tax=Ningiella sp. W23 TaxID=3023715 RepID=UPI0037576569